MSPMHPWKTFIKDKISLWEYYHMGIYAGHRLQHANSEYTQRVIHY